MSPQACLRGPRSNPEPVKWLQVWIASKPTLLAMTEIKTMPMQASRKVALASLLLLGLPAGAMADDKPLPAAIAAPGETVVLTVHAVGMQYYECKPGAGRQARLDLQLAAGDADHERQGGRLSRTPVRAGSSPTAAASPARSSAMHRVPARTTSCGSSSRSTRTRAAASSPTSPRCSGSTPSAAC